MLSIIITAFKEPNTIRKAIESILNQRIKEKYEILVICPDKETKNATSKYRKVRHIQDPGKGKPTALNIGFKEAKGNILILTDGDVCTSEKSIEEMIKPFKNKKIGATSGRPISSNPRNTMLGYWSHLLTDIGAHETRIILAKKEKFFVCSGYLMAIKSNIIKEIPVNSLSDDAVISNIVYSKNYKIAYCPNAYVYVKYPSTFRDWIKQKKRSTGGYLQMKNLTKRKDEMRSFTKESIGILRIFKYPKTFKEFIWTILLILARLYLWSVVLIDVKLKRKKFLDLWQRVETTK